MRCVLLRLQCTEKDRDKALSESRVYKYKYSQMKEKAKSMAASNSELLAVNSQLNQKVQILESRLAINNNPFGAFQGFGTGHSMMAQNVPFIQIAE